LAAAKPAGGWGADVVVVVAVVDVVAVVAVWDFELELVEVVIDALPPPDVHPPRSAKTMPAAMASATILVLSCLATSDSLTLVGG
jgi:hypothetical protein